MSELAHQAVASPGFSSMKWLGVFLIPLDGMLVHHRVIPSIKDVRAHCYYASLLRTHRVKTQQK